jgi:Putative adipose-regulatory protein (Seipin)
VAVYHAWDCIDKVDCHVLMEQEQRSLLPTRWLRRLTSGIGWFFVRSLLAILIPVIQYAFIFLLMVVFSIAGYAWVNFTFVPKALISEPLYFDFSRSPPVARISLLSREKQWHYTSDCLHIDPLIHENTRRRDNYSLLDLDDDGKDRPQNFGGDAIQECSGKDRKKFLRGGFRYSIDVMFGIASSPKNIRLGKFMVHAKVVDSAGSVVATSSRPVVMPHQSYVTLFLDALVKFPLRAIGVLKTAEVSDVLISVMNDFREPYEVSSSSSHSTSLTTEHVELRLSSADVDFNYAIISVMPALSGIT